MKDRKLFNVVEKGRVCGTSIHLGTDEWVDWCRKNKGFRFKPEQTSKHMLIHTVLVRNRNGAYWYACRKVNGTQWSIYVGKTKDIYYEKLQETAEILSLGETEYAQNRANIRRLQRDVQKAKDCHRHLDQCQK
jgi:hypothetical protein